MNRIIASSPGVPGLCGLSLLAGAGFARATEARLTLTGRVLGTRAKSIAGATVAIYTAAPRVGIGSACPSCYPECRKTAVTDAKGRFALAGLSNLLLYNLLIVRRGYVPQFVDRVDPLAAPIEPVLRVRDTVLAAALRTTVGR